jgi:cyclopropane fatty-acyl-phospholipid synthase-like methyltransferase
MDKQYWDNFYRNHSNRSDIIECSTFATFCVENFLNEKTKTIVDLGCGNARDAKYFANEHIVYALDQSIDQKIVDSNKSSQLNFIEQDFVHDEYNFSNNVDVFYSRFTIHSITKDEQDSLLSKVYRHLNTGGIFCIEVRTTKDSKFGLGKHICDTTYFNDNHTRRFIDSQDFLNKVLLLGFKVRYFNEQNNLSVYKDDNPVLMRVILEK